MGGGLAVYTCAIYMCTYSMVLLVNLKHSQIAAARSVSDAEELSTFPGLCGRILGPRTKRWCSLLVVLLELCFCAG